MHVSTQMTKSFCFRAAKCDLLGKFFLVKYVAQDNSIIAVNLPGTGWVTDYCTLS